MSEIPEALVEKACDVLVSHPSVPENRDGTTFYCPACGADDIAGSNSPTHALHQARAVLAAVLPDVRQAALDDLLQRADDGIEFGPENYSLLVRMVREVGEMP